MDLSNVQLKILRKPQRPPGAFSLFAIIKNECYLLPHFFEHYRKLGVETFVMYDDDSNDGSREFLLAQSDCFLVTSDIPFGTEVGKTEQGIPIRFGTALKKSFPATLVPKDWMLVVDADEFLLLPPGFSTLQEFAGYLETQKQYYVVAPMVDFYPAMLKDRNFDRSKTPFEGAPYFDLGPYFYYHNGPLPTPLRAGIRYRLLKQLHDEQPERTKKVYENHPFALAKLWKIPLLKHGEGIERIGDHEINLQANTDVMASLAHFKFTPDLDKKIAWALESKSYYNQSMEYRFLQAAIEHLDQHSLLSEKTCRYENIESLVEAHLCSKAPANLKSHSLLADSYWEDRKDAIYLFAARQICKRFCEKPERVIDVGSNNTPILEWFRASAHTLVSLDISAPYQQTGITSLKADFLSHPIDTTYDLVTCFQVLEHIPNARTFAQKLLSLAPIVVVSVPYMWPQGSCSEHVHDPVSEEKLLNWFGQAPIFKYLATEFNGMRRLIVVYEGQSKKLSEDNSSKKIPSLG
jgi:hypothetical protein